MGAFKGAPHLRLTGDDGVSVLALGTSIFAV
jgi:hypothetical protein